MKFKKYLLLMPIVALSACAYTLDEAHQEVEIRTPGAHDAVCVVSANKIKYKFYPPQKRLLPNSKEDLIIDCKAPGNRDRLVVIRPRISNNTFGNVATGIVPGSTWDYASGAMFTYPDVIEVDFTGMKIKPSAMPAHNNPDIRQPEDYDLEEFKSGSPRMNEDKHRKSVPIQKRVVPGSEADAFDRGFQLDSGQSDDIDASEYFNAGQDSGSYLKDMFSDDVPSDEQPSEPSVVMGNDDAVLILSPELEVSVDAMPEPVAQESEASESAPTSIPFPDENLNE